MGMRKKIVGIPFAWAETGTEGFVWAVQDKRYISKDGKDYSYKGLHCIRAGDYLELYQITGKRKKAIWKGYVEVMKWNNDPTRDLTLGGGRVHWIPEGIDLWQWAEIFMNTKRTGEFEAVLRKYGR